MNILHTRKTFVLAQKWIKKGEQQRLFSGIASRSLAESQLAFTLLEVSTMVKTFQTTCIVSEARFGILSVDISQSLVYR